MRRRVTARRHHVAVPSTSMLLDGARLWRAPSGSFDGAGWGHPFVQIAFGQQHHKQAAPRARVIDGRVAWITCAPACTFRGIAR